MNPELLDTPRYAAYSFSLDTSEYHLVGESSSLACACAMARENKERVLAYVLNRETMVFTYCGSVEPTVPGDGSRTG